MLPSSQLREVTINDYLVIFKRRFWIILSCFVIVATHATIKTFRKIPLYRADAKVIIERNLPYVTPIQQVYSAFSDKEYIQGQINIITSRTFAKKVVDALIAEGDKTFVGKKEPELSFMSGINVEIILGTNLIDIGYVSSDPVKAAKFANAVANVYIQQDVEIRVEASRSAVGWLDTQLTEVKVKLQDSETALDDYIQKNEIVSVQDVEKKTQATLDNLKNEKVKLGNELAELSRRYKAKHPKMIALNTRLESVTKSIEDETKNLLGSSKKMIQYNALKREVESNRSLYDMLLKRTKEAKVSKELETTNIRIVDRANVPRAPFSPNRRRDITTGILLGLVLGAGLAFFLEYLDSTVKTAADVEIYVRLPFLGYVPSARREVKTDKDVDLLSHNLPRSRVTEAYRSIRTSVIFSAPEDRPLKTILITSTSPQEGKTTFSVNLGIIFAHANEKVLIVEADMRKPRIAHSFGIESREGLSTFLTGASTLEKAVKQSSIPNLFIMPSGPRPPNPAELLTSAKTRELLEELKAQYDRIIIDSPPILTVADTAILANLVDGVIDIIRASFLNIDIILRARQRLSEVKSRIIGVVLNNVDVKKEDSYYYYHYYYAEEKDKKT